ncbi:MAG: NADH-quinone oxidoreductase subunit C [Planctomycetota bacterium]
MATLWTSRETIKDLLRHLKGDVEHPYTMLYDRTAIDERVKRHRDGEPVRDFTVVHTLLSYERNAYLRLKVPLPTASRTPAFSGPWGGSETRPRAFRQHAPHASPSPRQHESCLFSLLVAPRHARSLLTS